MANITDRADAVHGLQIEGLVRRWPVFSIWLAACALLGACWGVGVSPNGDFDDLMKFQKIRWFLETGAWFDQSVPGVLQPEPFLSHWPRLLDLPYAMVAWAAAPFIGVDHGLALAVFTVPLLLLLPTLLLYRCVVRSLGFERPEAAFLLAFFEFEPGRIDYHNVEILGVLAALALTFSRHRAAALANGALAALAMAISIEFSPFYALIAAVYAVEFIRGDDQAWRRAALFGVGLMATAPVCYAVIVAPAGYGAVRCDMYSTPHLLTLAMGGVTMAGSAVLGRGSRAFARVLLLMTSGGFALGSVALLFPQCLGGPYAALSAYLHDDWLMQILQERSVWQRPEFVFSYGMLSATVQFVGVGALAVVALRNRRHNRSLVVFAMFALLAAVLGILYSRNIRYLPIFAGPGILLVLAALLPPFRAKGSLLATSLDLDFRPLALLAPGLSLAALVIGLTAALARTAAPIPAAELAGSCELERLSAYQWPPTAHIMAPPDLAIRLLPKLSAGTSVVAVPYHTAAAGLERAYRFLDPATHDPQAFLGASAATHVVLCAWPAGPSAALEALYPFAASLMEGRAPAWLQECPAGAGSPVRIYRYPAAGSPGTICPSTSG